MNHKEAFCLMKYATKDRSEEEILWNSRDGVTPFMIASRSGKEMQHIDWSSDTFAPNHRPEIGERVFVDTKRGMIERQAIDYVEKYWNHGELPMSQHPFFVDKGKAGSVEYFIEEWTKPGSPHVLEITEFNRHQFCRPMTGKWRHG